MAAMAARIEVKQVRPGKTKNEDIKTNYLSIQAR